MTVPAHLAAELPQALKVWQTEGKHRFYCNGRIMVGPDINVSIFAATLTTGSCMLFWVFVCAQLSPRLHLAVTVGGVVLYLISLVFMVLTATTDPGILPRNPFMEDSEAGQRAQEVRTDVVNGLTVQLKWCKTCRIWRPPCASHCSECNVCVERFDHHCPWMGQCIGKRNYRYFLGFVCSTSALSVYTIGWSAYVFSEVLRVMRARSFVDGFGDAIGRAPSSGALVVFAALVLLCVGPLGCYHCSLICENRTTSEEIKQPYGRDANPFDRKSWRVNCHEVCCEPRQPSLVQMHSKMHSIAVCKEDAVSLMSKKGAGGESVATESQLGESQADD